MSFRSQNTSGSLGRGLGGFLLALTVSAPLASAQASRVGPTFLVNQYANGTGTQAKETDVAYDSVHGVYLEVWGFGVVYGRFVTGDGTVLGTGPFTIAGSAGYAACPRVAFSPDTGVFMVIWQDNRIDPNIPHIFGRLLSYESSGAPVFPGADFQVSQNITHPRSNPAIEYSTGSHVFLAVYQTGDLYGHRFDVTGAALGPEFKIAIKDPVAGDWYEQPDVAYNSTNDEFFVTFAHWIDAWGAGLIQGRRVRAGTEELSTLVDIDSLSRSTYGPTAVSWDPVRNQYLVAFYRIVTAFTTYGRFIAANGTPASSQFTIASTGTYVANGAAYNPISDTYFVVFPHHDIPEIYGAQVTGAGVVDPMIRVTTVLDSNPAVIGVDYPKVAAATDRPEWLATANIWWSGAIGQRVTTTTIGTPGIFSKVSPSNGAVGQTSSVTLLWTPVAGGSFDVCVDSINNNACDTSWQPVGLPTSTVISNLANGTYYWQVRNAAGGNTEANSGTWWSFAVGAVSFSKVAPTSGTGGLSSPVALTWSQLAGASSYQVCIDSTNNASCDSSWVSVGNVTSYPARLAVGTYYWQVRGYTGSYIVADGGTEWAFTVTVGATAAYLKVTPANGTTGVSNPVSFTWTSMVGATTYDICVDQINDDSCNTGWLSVGTATSHQISGLAEVMYYWQVRAWPTRTMADDDVWSSFTVGGAPPPPPTGFSKSAPANGATGVSATPTLSWQAVAGATFQLCVDTTNNNACDASWQTLGPVTSAALSTLPAGSYYWQVRAVTSGGTIEANSGAWWSFGVGSSIPPPSGFGKTSPAHASTGLATDVAVSWSTVANATYQVCISAVGPACDAHTVGWLGTAAVPGRTFESLTAGVYYWQARATVSGTTTEADGGTWWAFVVGNGSAANRFGKLSPWIGTTSASGTPVTLSWSAVTGATYEVCIDTVANTTCEATWQSAGSVTSLVKSSLASGNHYWQVRAVVNGTPSEANGGAWWTLTVTAPPPPLFSKLSPVSGSSDPSSSRTLTWGAVTNASYRVCLDTTNNNTCDGDFWWPTAVSPTRTFEGLADGTYYWQARATVDPTTTEADNGTWWSFTVGASDPGVIDMSPGNAPNGSWVFAEGTLGQTAGFTTYYAIANENADPVRVRGWLVNEDNGQVIFFQLPSSIAGHTRQTVALSAIVGPTSAGRYGAVFQSVPYAADNIPAGRQIYVARSSYWGGTAGIQTGPGHEKTGTLVAAGASLPTAWYFAEGTRVWSAFGQFETYYTVFNPSQTAANVVVEFLGDQGEGVIRTVTHTVAAQTRWTLSASAYADLNARNFSVRLTSTNGIGVVAERPMYWGAAWEGGHAGGGGTTTSLDWYFAEGTSQSGFATYYTLLNPTTQTLTVDATYQLSPLNGVPQAPVGKSYTLPPASRTTVYLYNEVGYQPGVAAEFHASGTIVAERSMYWSSPWTDGSTVSGASAPTVEWHLPEGSTINGYETFLLLSNPNTSAVTVDVTTFSSTGVAETKAVTVGAKSRLTVWMNNTTPADGPVFSSIQNATFSIRVVSTGTAPLPIVAEEAVYWNRLVGVGQYWRGGDATLGWPVIR